jgi:hypothetical protein
VIQRLRFLPLIASVLLIPTACHKSEGPSKTDDAPVVKSPPAQSPQPPIEPSPTRVDIDVVADDPDRWLFVEKPADRSKGGWATGSFDPEKNKLTIHTKDVERFAIDTSRIRIDWKRLVILGIDGKNSELRKRDFDLFHFALTDHGEWIVVEP